MRPSFPGGVDKEPNSLSLPKSVYVDAWLEALKHKWIESEKQGRDLGFPAIEDWYRQFWWKYCRARRLEHLAGEQQWEEFAPHEYGQMYEELRKGYPLLQDLVTKFAAGWENLDFMIWVHAEGKSTPEISEIIYLLAMININITRLEPRLHPHPPQD